MDENHNTKIEESSELNQVVYNFLWGGIIFIFVMGDHHQLSDVCQKIMYSFKEANFNSANCMGFIVRQDFMNRPDPTKVISTVMVIDEL